MSRIFGVVRQNGYVVKDIEMAMDQWISVMASGPGIKSNGLKQITFAVGARTFRPR